MVGGQPCAIGSERALALEKLLALIEPIHGVSSAIICCKLQFVESWRRGIGCSGCRRGGAAGGDEHWPLDTWGGTLLPWNSDLPPRRRGHWPLMSPRERELPQRLPKTARVAVWRPIRRRAPMSRSPMLVVVRARVEIVSYGWGDHGTAMAKKMKRSPPSPMASRNGTRSPTRVVAAVAACRAPPGRRGSRLPLGPAPGWPPSFHAA